MPVPTLAEFKTGQSCTIIYWHGKRDWGTESYFNYSGNGNTQTSPSTQATPRIAWVQRVVRMTSSFDSRYRDAAVATLRSFRLRLECIATCKCNHWETTRALQKLTVATVSVCRFRLFLT